jgi:nicotinamide/nicotinate riboside kinase
VQDVVAELDIRMYLRVTQVVLKQRRDARFYEVSGRIFHYLCVLSVLTSCPPPPFHLRLILFWGEQYDAADGTTWRDPPNYWENIVWPAHVEAHSHIFMNGDLAHGAPNGKVEDLVVIDGVQFDMGQIIDIVCKIIIELPIE